MAVYNNLQTIRRLTNSSLTSLIDVTNLNFKSLSDANLEFLNNINYDEVTNSLSMYSGTFELAEITNTLTISQSNTPTFTIQSSGNAVGKSILVEVSETQRQRFTDFPAYPAVGIPGEIVYTGVAGLDPIYGEDLIGYFQDRGWVSLTGGYGSSGIIAEGSGTNSTYRINTGNTASGDYSTVSGGHNNTASGYGSTVSGGYNNSTSIGDLNTVSGGYANSASGYYSSIAGGAQNFAVDFASVGGGVNNLALNIGSTISGGYANLSAGLGTTVGGGVVNTASGYYSAILGGINNSDAGCSCAMIVGSSITANRACTTFVNQLSIMNLPNGSAGLPTGAVYYCSSDSNRLYFVP